MRYLSHWPKLLDVLIQHLASLLLTLMLIAAKQLKPGKNEATVLLMLTQCEHYYISRLLTSYYLDIHDYQHSNNWTS